MRCQRSVLNCKDTYACCSVTLNNEGKTFSRFFKKTTVINGCPTPLALAIRKRKQTLLIHKQNIHLMNSNHCLLAMSVENLTLL